MSDRFPVTVIPVLGGDEAGTTETVNKVLPPGETELGLAAIPAWNGPAAVDELRGEGLPMVKSALLLSVSMLPPPLRRAAVVILRSGVLVPSKQVALDP